MNKYYLISYGYHYGNSSSASHHTCVTTQPPAEFIKDLEEEGATLETTHNQHHITFATEITEEEYQNFNKKSK
jgi:hypothetical protein